MTHHRKRPVYGSFLVCETSSVNNAFYGL